MVAFCYHLDSGLLDSVSYLCQAAVPSGAGLEHSLLLPQARHFCCPPQDFPGGSLVKNPPANAGKAGDAGDAGSIPGSGRSSGGGNGNSLQHSCLEDPMDRGAWWVIVHGAQRMGHD